MRLGAAAAVVLVLFAVANGLGPSRRTSTPRVLSCGQIRCQRNADCPANCGPCVTWSGTCALFGPHERRVDLAIDRPGPRV